MFVFGIITTETPCFRKKVIQNNKGRKKGRGIVFKEIWRRINFRLQAVEGWSSHMLQGENLFKDKSGEGRQKVDRGKDGKKYTGHQKQSARNCSQL